MHNTLRERADVIRSFNRFYTHQMGLLDEHLLRSEFSLTEARILFELGAGRPLTSVDLRSHLSLDAGYMSRVITGLEKRGLIEKVRSDQDARAYKIHLTHEGQRTLASLEEVSRDAVMALIEPLSEPQQRQLTEAMQQIEGLLGKADRSYILRDPQPGDMGLVVQQQAALYSGEYGWNSEFEALVAEIVAKYLREFDPARERCWIAEQGGQVVGSIFVVRHDENTAKLRMLYVDSRARGLGIGKRLVDETLQFARQAGYKRMILWTTSNLTTARKLYQGAGFELIEEEEVNSFGKDLVSQTWARDL
ncbi:bifunctional helix-turn-helix transcriptional regulator/GNAT family N-acetyltransferase [Pseudomonas asiatica]|uniref:bifunctional helix-turn-helix transcriptional regulator/GNAT family N-acetyltransferase n=1 Tax=Pseudomonas asiatica TaxID=2219225 RepID=UPI00209AEAAB|nr:bifunctional helix-turn-helix transcriptional regulator/GNAT family N-acetyltransferase [Pseudomonas asiatica]MCO7526718.1 bifunctional helix-turn-helix transcriptional regulator/GNAT family N-acetyltransferase [Pseudomonas asiatica]